MLRVGVIGCANIAERMVIPAILSCKELNLVAVSSRQKDKAKEFSLKYNCEFEVGYDALINRNDIDMIYMPLPTGLHLEWAIKAINKGKHLLLEKSLAKDYNEALAIVTAARENNVLIKENFMFEYHKQFKFIKELLAENKIGELRCFRSTFGFPPFPDKNNIRYSKQLAGGSLLDAGAYTIKVSNLLLGNNLEVVASVLNYHNNSEVDITGGVLMHDSKGCVVENSFGFDSFYQCELEILGTKGKITATRIFTAGPGVKPKILIETPDGTETIEIEEDNHFKNLLQAFHEIVQSGNYESEYQLILTQADLLEKTKNRAVVCNV